MSTQDSLGVSLCLLQIIAIGLHKDSSFHPIRIVYLVVEQLHVLLQFLDLVPLVVRLQVVEFE